MRADSQRLYDEFLDNYGLNRALYNHAVELSKEHFIDDEIKAIQFNKIRIAGTKAVINSTNFNANLHLYQAKAEQEVRKVIRRFRTYRLEEDDVEMLCANVEEEALRNLLYPFHLLTVESELEQDQFYPIAHAMEKIVQQVLGIIDNFYYGFHEGQGRIQQQKRDQIELENRKTDAWAANAPVRIRGRVREGLDGRLHFYGTANSTVTGGMVAADYQVNELMATQEARRKSLENQKGLLEYLEKSLMDVIGSYVNVWYDCLESLGGGPVGKRIIGISVYKNQVIHRPHKKEHMKVIFTYLSNEDNFAMIEYMLKLYDFDYGDLFGHKVAVDMYNSFIKTKKIDETDFYNCFYCYYYDVEHAIEHEPFFERFKELLKTQTRKLCEKKYQNNREKYTRVYCDLNLRSCYDLLDAIPGLDNKHRIILSNACHYIYYDVMGDTEFRDMYDEKNDVIVFDFDWDKK